jgi:alpha-galactosidase
MAFTNDTHGLAVRLGPKTNVNCLRVLRRGECIRTPEVHLGHTSGGFDEAIQAMHSHLRRSVLKQSDAAKARRIQYVVSADQGFYISGNEETILKCVDVAAGIGVELFILDAFWWDISLDWQPSKRRFPRGLEPIIRRVREKGMLFGLYIEPEGGRCTPSQSAIGKAHPEWFGPNNVLDLANDEAAAWMESEISRLVERYQLDLYRLDFNPEYTFEGPTTTRDGMVENNYWRYYEAFYGIHERLRARYPGLVLQHCSAGGARNDLGTVQRFHESYLTDGLSIPRELQVYSGLTVGLPPEIFVTMHGADGLVQTGKCNNLDTVLRITFTLSIPMFFSGMVAPSLEDLSPVRRARFHHYASIYRDFIRPSMADSTMYHHEPVNATGGVESSPWFAVEFVSRDRSKAWATVIRMRNGSGNRFVPTYREDVISAQDFQQAPYPEVPRYTFRPKGINPGARYVVTLDSKSTRFEVMGYQVMNEGISLCLENLGMSELIMFEEVPQTGSARR